MIDIKIASTRNNFLLRDKFSGVTRKLALLRGVEA